ncbi:unnamed protein product [Psylliodes chrysocephalus]|uniref:Endonuclease/exonuclease/phosphatase domain-containing protein n=1 Tax=Psylliodes chrysocephalus TaxID=3402493 RepID=A0A9P0CMK1_9CUCU|nr:unnamed protein product [Psylliodes chrysocephala]
MVINSFYAKKINNVMLTFIKFHLFDCLEVSKKLAQLIPVQRMYFPNHGIVSNVRDTNLIPNQIRSEEDTTQSVNQTVNYLENGVNSNYNTNLQFWNPYCENFYFPIYYRSDQHYSNFHYPFFPNTYYNYYNYYQPYTSRTNFHTGRGYQKKSFQNNNSGKQIMSLRTWEKVAENPGTRPGFIFTLMSYNVLAQDLLEQHPYLYRNHDEASLAWPIRWKNLFKEISKMKPDILCLQEVQKSHLSDYSLLEEMGYQSVFKKRTGCQPDGCAIYYKADNIALIENDVVEYFQSGMRVLDRDNVGIVMKFAPKSHPTKEFVVATTHLLYNPKRDDVRMAQMQLLLANVEKMSYKRDRKLSYYLPVIITGDLNTPPDSSLYEFVTKGKINFEHISPRLLENHQDSSEQKLVTSSIGITDNSQYHKVIEKRKDQNYTSKKGDKEQTNEINRLSKMNCTDNMNLTHNFYFKSVYDHGARDTKEATTYQDEWLTVDYIFYSKKKGEMYPEDKLKLLSKYRLPTNKELNGTQIPNKTLGSDHLSLVAKFKLDF